MWRVQLRPGSRSRRRPTGRVRLFLRLVRSAGLPEPERQDELHVAGERYFIDFAYPDHRIAIELDGLEKRTARTAVDRELARQNALVLADWTVLRFTKSLLTARPAAVIEDLLRAFAA